MKTPYPGIILLICGIAIPIGVIVKSEIDEYVDRRVERATSRLQKEINFKDDEIALRDNEIRALNWELSQRPAPTTPKP